VNPAIFGIGVDLVEIPRLRDSIARHGPRFYQRICTESELAYCLQQRDPVPCIAARFAAKEAVAKALGTGLGAHCGWMDIEIRRKATGEPFVVLHGAAAETARRLQVGQVLLSLSHTDSHAIAFASAISLPTDPRQPA
jgi:holo-[acyl-carrier protein] synthase